MKVKIIALFAFLAIAILIGHYSNLKSDKGLLLSSLSSLESMAACEVSPYDSDNIGYCTYIYGGGGWACIATGYSSQARCAPLFF